MAVQSEIGTWQQIAAWEKSIAEKEGRHIAPSPPRSKPARQADESGEAAGLRRDHFVRNHRELDER
jgi:hypothetical protein